MLVLKSQGYYSGVAATTKTKVKAKFELPSDVTFIECNIPAIKIAVIQFLKKSDT